MTTSGAEAKENGKGNRTHTMKHLGECDRKSARSDGCLDLLLRQTIIDLHAGGTTIGRLSVCRILDTHQILFNTGDTIG